VGWGRRPIKALEKELGLLALSFGGGFWRITPARGYLRLNLISFVGLWIARLNLTVALPLFWLWLVL